MTGLDLVYMSVRGYDEEEQQVSELFDALYTLDIDHPEELTEQKVQVKSETLNRILTAYRKLTN